MKYLLSLLFLAALLGCDMPADGVPPVAPLPITAPAVDEPVWTDYPAVRNVRDMGPVLTDVESHLVAGHPYANPGDIVNWVHEGTHGINSQLRGLYGYAAFYVLNNKAVRIAEPACTLRDVAGEIPVSLRGFNYRLYFIQQLNDWNEHPTYPFDEWCAYTNGAEARLQRQIADRDDTVRFALEFVPYAICVSKAMRTKGLPEDQQMKAFLRWQTERCVRLGKSINIGLPSMAAADAESLRDFCHLYFGVRWSTLYLGI